MALGKFYNLGVGQTVTVRAGAESSGPPPIVISLLVIGGVIMGVKFLMRPKKYVGADTRDISAKLRARGLDPRKYDFYD